MDDKCKWTAVHGMWISEQLAERRLSHAGTAIKIGVSRSTLLRWVSGTQSPLHPRSWNNDGFQRLAKLLGFRDAEEMLLAMPGSAAAVSVSGSPCEGSLSRSARRILAWLHLRGTLQIDSLAANDQGKQRAGLRECTERELVAVRTDGSGRQIAYLPDLALHAELSLEALSCDALATRLGLTQSAVEQICNGNPDMWRLPQGPFALQAHRYQLIILDWSNTLVDETALDDAICEEIGRAAGRDRLLELLHRLELEHDPRWYDYFHLGKHFGIQPGDIVRFHKLHSRRLRWIEGSQALLRYCGRVSRCALATNCVSSVLELRFQAANIPRKTFAAIVTSDQTREIRNKAAHYEAVLRALGADPRQTLVIGDNFECDILPAMEIGMNALWFQYGKRRSLWGSPSLPAPADDLGISALMRQGRPSFVSLNHSETLGWLAGSPVTPRTHPCATETIHRCSAQEI